MLVDFRGKPQSPKKGGTHGGTHWATSKPISSQGRLGPKPREWPVPCLAQRRCLGPWRRRRSSPGETGGGLLKPNLATGDQILQFQKQRYRTPTSGTTSRASNPQTTNPNQQGKASLSDLIWKIPTIHGKPATKHTHTRFDHHPGFLKLRPACAKDVEATICSLSLGMP